jgi:hypothetical protein
VTEYQVVSRRCGGCGHVSEPTATDMPREVTPDTITDTDGEYSSDPATAPESGEGAASTAVDGPGDGTDPGVALVLRPGSPVRIGPYTTALLAAMSGIGISTGFMAGARRRAAAAPGNRVPAPSA